MPVCPDVEPSWLVARTTLLSIPVYSTTTPSPHPICHLEALNTTVAITLCTPQFAHQLFHLFCNNEDAVTIFQADNGKVPFRQACTRDIWQVYAQRDITLKVGHILVELLSDTADDLRRYHLGQTYRDRVSSLPHDKSISLHAVPDHRFTLSDKI